MFVCALGEIRDWWIMTYGSPSLSEMAEEVYVVNQNNGWFDAERTVGDDIALLTTEVGEAYEAFRISGLSDTTDKLTKGLPKPEGFGSELADILIRLLDTAYRRGINLDHEYRRKLEYNKTRGYHHGGKVI